MDSPPHVDVRELIDQFVDLLSFHVHEQAAWGKNLFALEGVRRKYKLRSFWSVSERGLEGGWRDAGLTLLNIILLNFRYTRPVFVWWTSQKKARALLEKICDSPPLACVVV